jgi:anthranilate synthase/aminodeoxychorismate synthase-like glutamine amidotransferase
MTILLIDNYDSFTYNLYQYLRHYHDVVVLKNDEASLVEIQQTQWTGVVISPGPGGPMDAGCCLAVVQAYHQHVPILGVCLGHQVIADFFGARVRVSTEPCHGEASALLHDESALFAGVPARFMAARYHSLLVQRSSVPSTLLISCQDESGSVMGLRHRLLPVYGLQFHPESILTPHGETVIKNFMSICNREN